MNNLRCACLFGASIGVLGGCASDQSNGSDVSVLDGESDYGPTDQDATNDAQPFSLQSVAIWGKNGVGGLGTRGVGQADDEFGGGVSGIALSPDETEVYVNDGNKHRIVVMSPAGEFLRSWPTLPPAQCETGSEGLTVGPDGTLYTADQANHAIVGYGPMGDVRRSWPMHDVPRFCGAPELHTHAFAIDTEGRVYVSEQIANQIQVFAPDGTFLRNIGEYSPLKGFAHGPMGIAWANGRVFANDGDRVLVYRDTGELERFLLAAPGQDVSDLWTGLVVWHGWVFVGKTFDPPGFLAAAPGGTGLDFVWLTEEGLKRGDLNVPFSMAIDARGRWYVSELFASRVQVFDAILPTL